MINDEDETNQLSAINRKDDTSSLTIEMKGDICTEYFDTPNSNNYFKRNFEETEKVNDPPIQLG